MQIRLTGCPSALRAAGFEPISYRSIPLAAVEARIPACQINNIWYFSPDNIARDRCGSEAAAHRTARLCIIKDPATADTANARSCSF